jgi:flagellar hook protein FlgE
MSNALQTAVLGMQAYQEMLNVAGNNLANADTVGYKDDRISFTDMFSRTLTRGTPSGQDVGGTDPVQIGLGVRVGTVDKNMSQGSFTSTDKDFDLALDGQGFFVANDGTNDLYTRDGTFNLDSDGYLVDPATGYRVQRIGTTGEDTGFQTTGDPDIMISYKTQIPGQATSTIDFVGNLSASDYDPSTSRLQSHEFNYALADGGLPGASAQFSDVTQLQSFADGDTIAITGTARDGTAVSSAFTYGAGNDGTTLQDLMNTISDAFGGPAECDVSLESGKLTVADTQSGYSLLDVNLSSASHPEAVPADFDYLEVGGVSSQPTNITIYDRQSNTHNLTVTFVRQAENAQVWDMVVTQATGATSASDRRIAGITFDENGTFQGISGEDGFGHKATDAGFGYLDDGITVEFPGITTAQDLSVNLGKAGFYDGLTQLGGDSTAGAVSQDGCGAGSLQQLVVDSRGVISGTFSNGKSLDIAAIRVAVFDNPEGLERVGNNYYGATPAAGDVVYSSGTQGRAGNVRQSVLEDSTVDIAKEFTNLIVAQQGFQVNSRTVRVVNTILQQLASIIM